LPFCEYCGEEIGYLPFKCKYCNGTFCKKHRLPENHECTFDFKPTPRIPSPSIIPDTQYPKKKTKERNGYDFESRKYNKKRYRRPQRTRLSRTYDSNFIGGETKASNYLIIMIVIFSIVAIFLPQYLCLSLYGITQLYIWIIISSIFISYGGGFLGLLFLFILIFFFYNISRNIEQRFGTQFLTQLFIICAVFTGIFYVLIRYLLIFSFPITLDNAVFIGLATGAILGLISFMVYFAPNRDMMLLCFFIPVKMKGKTLIIILILFRLIPGLFFGIIVSPLYFAIYFPDLGGVLGSYIVFKMKFQRNY
jgi:hypothetical protein